MDNVEIRQRAGAVHQNADALSRFPFIEQKIPAVTCALHKEDSKKGLALLIVYTPLVLTRRQAKEVHNSEQTEETEGHGDSGNRSEDKQVVDHAAKEFKQEPLVEEDGKQPARTGTTSKRTIILKEDYLKPVEKFEKPLRQQGAASTST